MAGEKVVVRFLNKSAPYNAGEVAGFAPEEAQKLVDGGLAIFEPDPPTKKAISEPAVHRMVETPTVKKEITPKSKKQKGTRR
jgi:hypothetical protein